MSEMLIIPLRDLQITATYSFYDDFYSAWDIERRQYYGSESYTDRTQAWLTPSYSTLDISISYTLPHSIGMEPLIFAQVNNVFDAIYVQDAVDNSGYGGYGARAHLAHNAGVFLGLPRHFNAGLRLNF